MVMSGAIALTRMPCGASSGRLREVHDARFRRGVGGVAGGRPHPLDGRDIDDATAATGGDHGARDPLGAEQHVTEVRAVEGLPAVGRGVEQSREEGRAGVVDQHVHPLVLGQRPRECGIDLVGIAHVVRHA
jgi:hypothetical protein